MSAFFLEIVGYREDADDLILSAENGCFIKTRVVGNRGGDWINMVANFNLTWKSACLEILNYVRFSLAVYLASCH